MLGYIVLVVMALVSVIASELLSIGALANAPAGPDLTHSFFVSLVLPSIIVVAVLNGLILWKVFGRLQWRGISLYTAIYAIAYGAVLTLLGNPLRDIAIYVVMVLIVAPVVLGTFNAVFWKRAPAPQ